MERTADISAGAAPSRSVPGGTAERPTALPPRALKAVAVRAFRNFSGHRISLVAAGVAFYGLLALVPALAALIALYGLVLDPETIRSQVATLEGVLPGGAMEIVRGQVDRLVARGDGSLGIAFGVATLISLWSANAAMKSLFQAMNIAYGEDEGRGFLRVNLLTLAFTLGAMAAFVVLLALMVALPAALGHLPLGPASSWVVRVASFLTMALVLFFGLALLYRWGPDRVGARWRWVTPGAILASVVAIAGSMLFTWYAANFGAYNATYGSLGAVIGLMTWLWITAIVVLAGAEIDAAAEGQTVRDTTAGPERPMGERGARVADEPPPREAAGA